MPGITGRTQEKHRSGLAHSYRGSSRHPAGPGYFSPDKTGRSKSANMERNVQKGDATLTREKETEEPEKEISLKPVTTGNNTASMTQNKQKLLERKWRKGKLPFRN